MKKNTLSITIQRPRSVVFAFTLNPKNTPRWIEGITEEVASEWPPKIGTIYKNRGASGSWSHYVITAFETDVMMEMQMIDSNYHVRYTYTPINDNASQLEYHEWVDEGDLAEPFAQETIVKLKDVIENEA